jgi:hypothetical protein
MFVFVFVCVSWVSLPVGDAAVTRVTSGVSFLFFVCDMPRVTKEDTNHGLYI